MSTGTRHTHIHRQTSIAYWIAKGWEVRIRNRRQTDRVTGQTIPLDCIFFLLASVSMWVSECVCVCGLQSINTVGASATTRRRLTLRAFFLYLRFAHELFLLFLCLLLLSLYWYMCVWINWQCGCFFFVFVFARIAAKWIEFGFCFISFILRFVVCHLFRFVSFLRANLSFSLPSLFFSIEMSAQYFFYLIFFVLMSKLFSARKLLIN